jgi:hypothetical protein
VIQSGAVTKGNMRKPRKPVSAIQPIGASPDKSGRADTKVSIRVFSSLLTIACGYDGDLVVTGDRPDVAAIVHTHMLKNLLSRGRTLSDALRIAKAIAQTFDGEILDLAIVLDLIREGWTRLLVANLMADPSQSHGERMNEFHACRGLVITIEATPHHVVHCSSATIDIGDQQFLVVWRLDKPRWRARWENLTGVSFSYSEPPPKWLQEEAMKKVMVRRDLGKPTKAVVRKSEK